MAELESGMGVRLKKRLHPRSSPPISFISAETLLIKFASSAADQATSTGRIVRQFSMRMSLAAAAAVTTAVNSIPPLDMALKIAFKERYAVRAN